MSETERRINDVRTALESLGADFDAVDSFSLTDEERSRIREQISHCYQTLGKLLDRLDREQP